MVELTIAQLIDWLRLEAELNDTFGPTLVGTRLRLAASVIADMERLIDGNLSHLQSEVERLQRELAARSV